MLRFIFVSLLIPSVAFATSVGSVTISESSSDDSVINAAECNGSTTDELTLDWIVASDGTEPTLSSGTFTVEAATGSDCPDPSGTVVTLGTVTATSATGTYPSSGTLTVSRVVSSLGLSSCTDSDTVYFCVTITQSGTTYSASGSILLDSTLPPAPVDVVVTPGENALHVAFAEGTTNSTYSADSSTFTAVATSTADGSTHSASGTSPLRITGLENGVTYDVVVYAVSSSGNEGPGSTAVSGTPVPVTDFWESYRNASGSENGGCGAGASGGLSLLLVLLLLGARRLRGCEWMARGLLLLIAVPAASLEPQPTFSGVSVELRLGQYHPNIDAEFSGSATPWADHFGSGDLWMANALVSKELLHGTGGTLEAGLGVGYAEKVGHGLLQDGTTAADTTAFKVVPLQVALTYRLEVLADQAGIPLVPYLRGSFLRYQWWLEDGNGDTSTDGSGSSGAGATHGFAFTCGLALRLDAFDASLASEMQRDSGMHHVSVFVDVTRAWVKNFGSTRGFDLSDRRFALAGGILVSF